MEREREGDRERGGKHQPDRADLPYDRPVRDRDIVKDLPYDPPQRPESPKRK
jgi:hypothetical protein